MENLFLIIYRPNLFPNLRKQFLHGEKKVQEAGFKDLYLGYIQSFGQDFDS
jgi:hypothetical protein